MQTSSKNNTYDICKPYPQNKSRSMTGLCPSLQLLSIFIIWRVCLNITLPVAHFAYHALASVNLIPAFTKAVVTRLIVIHHICWHIACGIADHCTTPQLPDIHAHMVYSLPHTSNISDATASKNTSPNISCHIRISTPYYAVTAIDQALVDHLPHFEWQMIPASGHICQRTTLCHVTLIKLRLIFGHAQIGYWGATGAPR